MKLLITLALLGTTGCAGTMLDGRVCTFATDEGIRQDIETVAQAVAPKDKEQVAVALTAARLSATAYCEAARYKQGVK